MNSRATLFERHRGFSIVELMVAMTLSLILVAGVLSLVYSSKITYLENDRVARNQEGGRAAFQMILRDIRGAGFPGCAQPIPQVLTTNNLLTNNTTLLWQLDAPVQGYEGSSGTFSPALDAALSGASTPPLANNDVLVVRTVQAGFSQFSTSQFTNPTDNIVVNKLATETVQGTTFVINDCGGATFFAAQVTDNGTTATFTLPTSGTAPTNSSANLLASFTQGALVTPVDTIVYYIGQGSTPAATGGVAGPSLWRMVGNSGPQELVPGVERMELLYGVDTNGDAIVDEYDDAHTVTTAGNWGGVMAVQIAILVRSPEPNAPVNDTKVYTLLGTTAGPFNDKYERSVFTTTVTLRNRTT